MLFRSTKAFRNTNITDRWVIFDEDDPNVNWTALQNALDSIHGVIAPPVPPTPQETPENIFERLAAYVEREFARLSAA